MSNKERDKLSLEDLYQAPSSLSCLESGRLDVKPPHKFYVYVSQKIETGFEADSSRSHRGNNLAS